MTTEENLNANREIKDGVFKMLFEPPEKSAELHNALTEIPCTAEEIQPFSLNMVISGSLYNDLGMIVRGRLIVLAEHMSTSYSNMPFRFLLYLTETYDRLIKQRGEKHLKYQSKLYKIPTPQFVVFYNGTEKRPEREILRLSDAFMEKFDHEKLGNLELKVVVYNINKGYNTELLAKCPTLRQYSDFIAKIREYEEKYQNYNKSVKEAIEYCIANDILADFLKKNGGKIVSILFTDFNLDDAKEVWREEAREEGLEEGMEKGIERGREEGMEQGLKTKAVTIAKKLLGRNYPIADIVEDTGLTYAEINQLIAEG